MYLYGQWTQWCYAGPNFPEHFLLPPSRKEGKKTVISKLAYITKIVEFSVLMKSTSRRLLTESGEMKSPRGD